MYEQIIVGDFNLHNQEWTGQDETACPTNHTTCLKKIIIQTDLEQCVLVGTITRPPDRVDDIGTTIDLVWTTEGVRQMLHNCRVQHDLHCDSYHLPIDTTIDMTPPQRPDELRRNYAARTCGNSAMASNKVFPRIRQ